MSKLIPTVIMFSLLSCTACSDRGSGNQIADVSNAVVPGNGADVSPTLSDVEFLRCWQARPVGNGRFEINFQATVYPREGVLSRADNCPDLRLELEFHDPELPTGFDVFELRGRDPTKLIGIRGVARVNVKNRERPDLLVVTVEDLREGTRLSDAETERLRSRD